MLSHLALVDPSQFLGYLGQIPVVDLPHHGRDRRLRDHHLFGVALDAVLRRRGISIQKYFQMINYFFPDSSAVK
jgi:hypothetical protein